MQRARGTFFSLMLAGACALGCGGSADSSTVLDATLTALFRAELAGEASPGSLLGHDPAPVEAADTATGW